MRHEHVALLAIHQPDNAKADVSLCWGPVGSLKPHVKYIQLEFALKLRDTKESGAFICL